MSNLGMALYLMDELNICNVLDKRDEYWVIRTENKEFWYNEDGSYYGMMALIPGIDY